MHVNDYGVIGCAEFDVALSRLEAALDEAKRLGVTGTAYTTAKKFFDDEKGFWTRNWVMTGDFCNSMTAEATRLLNSLNTTVALVGGTTVAPSGLPVQREVLPSPKDFLGDLKWILIAGAAIGGLYFFGPPIKAALGMRRRTA